jgi:hypothetical protein
MGEGLLRHFGGEHFEVFSGGLVPSYVRPNAIAVMKELGIDISHHRSKSVNEFVDGEPFDYVITVCDYAAQYCPTFPGEAKRIHWSIADPVVIGDAAASGRGQAQPRESVHRDLAHAHAGELRGWPRRVSEVGAERRDLDARIVELCLELALSGYSESQDVHGQHEEQRGRREDDQVARVRVHTGLRGHD